MHAWGMAARHGNLPHHRQRVEIYELKSSFKDKLIC